MKRQRALEQLLQSPDLSVLQGLFQAHDPALRQAAWRTAVTVPALVSAEAVLAALREEQSPRVLTAIADFVRQHPLPDPRAVQQAIANGVNAANPWLQRRIVLGLLQGELESLMSDGEVPGFYDGQFQGVWELDAKCDEILLRVAHESSFHFVIRAMAVMALHETKDPELEDRLGSLVMNPYREFDIDKESFFRPRPIHPIEIRERRDADLSRYCRFSLAKAGMTQAIREMIQRMDLELHSYARVMESRGNDDEELMTGEDFTRLWLRGLLFSYGILFSAVR